MGKDLKKSKNESQAKTSKKSENKDIKGRSQKAKKIKKAKKIPIKKVISKKIAAPTVKNLKSTLRNSTRSTKAKKVGPPKHEGYTDDQFKKFKELKEDFEDKSIPQLKEMLRINCQSRTGTKSELITKVADGIIKGAIPRCSKCGGGFLKYIYQTDTYWCNGYMDDTKWRNCHFKGKSPDVQRMPWQTSD